MRANGLESCIGNEGTYVQQRVIVGTHVDDLLAIGDKAETLNKLEDGIEESVELEKRGRPERILGMELKLEDSSVILTQSHLIESTHQLYSTQFLQYKKLSLPTNIESFERTNSTDIPRYDKTKYQALVGSLLFIARMTCVEIAIHVNLLGPLAEDSSTTNYQAVLRVLGYLHSTRSEGVSINKPSYLQLEAYADASYGGPESRSQTGVILTIAQQPIG